MGRIKNLKNKEKLPSLSISREGGQNNKRTNFGEDNEVEEDHEIESDVDSVQNDYHGSNNQHDEMPEEIKSNSADIFQLKAQLEKVIGNKKKSKAKRKRVNRADADDYIDSSVIEALEDDEEDDDNNNVNNPAIEPLEEQSEALQAVDNQKKKKIGNFEIVLLEDEGNSRISSLYHVSEDVSKFDKSKFSKVSRGSFAKQARLRRPLPSKQFAVSTK